MRVLAWKGQYRAAVSSPYWQRIPFTSARPTRDSWAILPGYDAAPLIDSLSITMIFSASH